MTLAFAFLSTILLSVAQAWLFYDGPHWTNLKVTLGLPLQEYAFNGVPLTQRDATNANWTPLGSDCLNNGQYNGYRYASPDGSIAALYDVKLNVAGFQMLTDKNKLLTKRNEMENSYKFDEQSMFHAENVLGIDQYVLTAYFIAPDSICTTGGQNVPEGEIGNGLWLQNGPTPASTFIAPKKREDAKNSGWNNNRCLPLNGYHNFYQSDKWGVDNCTSMKPVWFFYNRYEDLMGFGFTVVGYDDSPRYQHPPGSIVKFVFADGAPQCAADIGEGIGYSNINVYFENYPELIIC